MEPQQLPVPAPGHTPNAFIHPPIMQNNYPPYSQTSLPQGDPHGYQQSPPIPQPYHGITNMTSQQVQQVQQVVQDMPPEKLQLLQQQVQQVVQDMPQEKLHLIQQQLQAPPPQYPPTTHFPSPPPYQFPQPPSYTTTAASSPKDAEQSGKVKRFFGDTLFGRVARSSVSTATSFAKMPLSLSPWGDNNPVTLPNVRYRDAVLFTTFAFVGGPLVDGAADSVTSAFGADSFVAEIINSGAGAIAASTVLKYSVFQIVEQALDKGILEHMLPEEERMLTTTEVKSLQVSIKHKLMGVDADLRFVGVRPATDPQCIAKGWFCPYLFASARTPCIPRARDFSIAQCFGPFLGGDYLLAHKLLSETPHTLALCDPTPTHDLHTNRLLLLFTALSPYRANMWSTSRRPGSGTLTMHILSGCPCLVIPVTSSAPLLAWSPWTLAQMRDPGSGYDAAVQHEEICEFLASVLSVGHLQNEVGSRWEAVLARSVSLVINGALATERCGGAVGMGRVDPERAGIVMLRY